MATYRVKNNETGQTITFQWNDSLPPTDADMEDVFSEASKIKPASVPAESTKVSLPPAQQPVPRETENKPFFSQLSKYWTKDIPETVKGASQRTEEAWRSAEQSPTTLGTLAKRLTGATGKPAEIIEAVAGTPEATARKIGATGTTFGEITGIPVTLGAKAIKRWTGGKVDPESAISGLMQKIAGTETAQNISRSVADLPEEAKANLKATGGIIELMGLRTVPKVPKIKGKVGESIENVGKSTLRSQMKPKDITSRLAGRNAEEGAQKLADDISKYKLESVGKGFSGISKNAERGISENMQAAENAIIKAAADNPAAAIDIDNSFVQFMDNLQGGKIDAVFGDEVKAAELANDIYSALELRGLTGTQPIAKIPEIKQVVSKYGGGLFKKGAYNVSKDPLKQQVGELTYFNLTKDLENIVPNLRQHNQAVRDMINVKTASDEALKRIGNKDKVGLYDWMLLLGGPAAAHSMGLPGQAAGIIPGGIMVTRKALSSGRGPSALIKTGRAIKGKYSPEEELRNALLRRLQYGGQ